MMQNFLIGGASGMIATTVIQPIDFLKVQIQVQSEMGRKDLNPLKIIREVRASEGSYGAFYRGLDSALMRQIFYTSTRLGLFYTIKDNLVKKNKREPNVLENTLASLFSGAVGSIVGNPADLALIRMQSDNNLPANEKRNYKNVFDAIIRIVREEGVMALWRGSTPTVFRAMAMNFSLLVPFEFTKKKLAPYVESNKQRSIYASLISGGCASVLALPFDNVKTKLQKMKAHDGKMPYSGVLDCFKKSIQKEGAARLWVGLNTFYIRVAPHAIISLVVNDFLRGMFVNKK
jgi:solute carrier family 25 oxoglutarate transporter 11